MHKLQILASIFALLFIYDDAKAGDKEDILAFQKTLSAAWNANDVIAVRQHYAPDFDAFQPQGDLLTTWNWDRVKAWHEKGSITIGDPQHQETKVFGNTAIITYYLRITINSPDGKTETQTRRSTAILTKRSGKWKYQHYMHRC